MKVFQGHMARCMKKFDWLNSFQLERYTFPSQPLVMFGCYKREDWRIIQLHKAPVIVIWMGTDTHKQNFDSLRNEKKIIHTTWIPGIKKYLKEKGGIDVQLLKLPVKEYPYPLTITELGPKVYGYIQKGKPQYHGSDEVESLEIDYPVLIGDHSISRRSWYAGLNNKFYSKAFIGLALSREFGGAMTIQEMAVRGIRVVTNVLQLPNCIPWNSVEDIEHAINREAGNIGKSNNGLVEECYDSMVPIRGCFDLDKLLV